MRFVAFIRNVMVGRQGLHREVLAECFERAGAENVQSHLATGNVTFTLDESVVEDALEQVEYSIAAVIDRPEPVILRRHAELQSLVASDPFIDINPENMALEVTFLDQRATPLDVERFVASAGLQVVACTPCEVLTAQQIGAKVRHPLPIVEKFTGGRATTRAWSTVKRIAEFELDRA